MLTVFLFSFVDATQTYTKLHEFNNSLATDGGVPYNNLILASNGLLYGTTTQDGASGGLVSIGTIFSFNIGTSTFTKVFNFSTTTTGKIHKPHFCKQATASFMASAWKEETVRSVPLYSFDPITATFTKLTDLSVQSNGGGPLGMMTKASNGLYYGMTKNGGANFGGVLFSFNPANSVYTKLIDLPANALPEGSLLQASNGKLYGMTFGGGSSGLGSLFSYEIATNVYTVVSSLANATGRNPSGGLIQGSDGFLYGMTTYGGANSAGTIFKFDITTSTYTKVADFNSATTGWNTQRKSPTSLERPYVWNDPFGWQLIKRHTFRI
ncbi:MAG: hypothetical protein IPP51_07685 [Bacteroidetes bacterium]|nr:hypothetical protein [Bacteroidota bacterium]